MICSSPEKRYLVKTVKIRIEKGMQSRDREVDSGGFWIDWM